MASSRRPDLPAVVALFAAFSWNAANERRVAGELLEYGAVAARDGIEVTFASGSVEPLPAALRMNVQHDRARPVALLRSGADLFVKDDRLMVDVELPQTAEGDRLLEGIREGFYTGLSMEVTYNRYRWAEGSDKRLEVLKGSLHGLAVVDKPGFSGSVLHAREHHGAEFAMVDVGQPQRPINPWADLF